MAHHKAALKSIKQSKTRNEHNRYFKSTMRTAVKKTRTLIEQNKVEEAKAQLTEAFSVIDRCAGKKVIHKNAAARYKSHLNLQLNRMVQSAK